MHVHNPNPVKTYPAGAVMGNHLRVVLSSGQLALASNTQRELGVLNRRVLEVGEDAPVILRNAQGTVPMVAAGAIALGAEVFAAANGKVAATGTVSIGTAETAAAADNDFIEVLRF
jgi:CMP-2-keto-3-deoxyoctulosonic acid synthetase